MRKVKRFDELPNKIKYIVGGGIKNKDEAMRHFGDMTVYECKNKDEVYKQMKRQSLECMTMIDKNPNQARSFFVALGLPGRRSVDDLINFNEIVTLDTVVYFAELSSSEIKDALREEKAARDHYREKLARREKKNEQSQDKSDS